MVFDRNDIYKEHLKKSLDDKEVQRNPSGRKLSISIIEHLHIKKFIKSLATPDI